MGRNVEFLPYEGISPWRKIAVGTWSDCGDPSVYGSLELDAGPLLAVIEDYRKKGFRLTPTALVAKGIALSLREFPLLNGVLRFGRIYQRKTRDIFLQVAPDSKEDNLSGILIHSCDEKSLEEIAMEIRQKSGRIKAGDDFEFKAMKSLIRFVPGALMGPILRFMGFLLYTCNFWSKGLNSPRDGFGSAMVTSVGMLGIDQGYAPLVPYSRCPFLIAVGRIVEKPVVVEGKVVVRPMMNLGVTLDHRLIDGKSASYMLKAFRDYMAAPT